MDYDSNMTNSGRCAKQTVELTFQMNDYRKSFTTTVIGNVTGLRAINQAVEKVIDELGGDDGTLVLERGEDTLLCEIWEFDPKDMLVEAKITAIEPYGTVADVMAMAEEEDTE